MIAVKVGGPRGGSIDGLLTKQLEQAVSFCIDELNLSRFKAFIDIMVPRKRGYFPGEVGGYASSDREHIPGEGNVWMCEIELANVSRAEMLSTLCHEMVHVKQYLRKELIGNKWKGKVHKTAERDPFEFNSPWEKEAYSLEDKLFKKMQKNVDFKWLKKYNCNFERGVI